MAQAALAAQLIEAGRRLDARNWVPGGGGNFSARVDAEQALLTASGCHKGRLSEGDFLLVDLQGQPRSPGRTASAETLLHCERLRALPEAGCVLHTHSPACTVLGRRTIGDTLWLAGYEMLKGLCAGPADHAGQVAIPIFENDQDITRLAAQVAERHAREPIAHGYLIRGHGLYAWGHDVEAAVRHVEALEFLLHCHLLEEMLP